MQKVLEDISVYGAKSAVVLLVLVLLYRLLGKREVGQMNVYDLVMIVALSNAVQNAMTGGKGDLWIGLASSSALILLGWALSRLFVRAPGLQKWIVGTPTLLVYQGQLYSNRLRREHVSLEELTVALHSHGLTDPSEAELAVLETDGSISIVPRGEGTFCSAELT